MTSQVYQIAGVQMPVAFADPERNATLVIEHLHSTVSGGAELTIFPECALSGYCFSDRTTAYEASLDPNGAVLGRVIEASRSLRSSVVVGYLERSGAELYNSVSLIGPDGLIATYRKVHLPKLGVDRFTCPGRQPFQVIEHRGLRLGMLICYDCSFPEATRVLALQGADLVVLPTNWPTTSGLTADYVPNCRALENQIYFAAINRIGSENGFEFLGKSKICAPGGRDLAFANHDQFEILKAEVRPALARAKHLVLVAGEHEIDRFADRHPEFYGRVGYRETLT
jgi:predicted amidohydrolase